MPKVSVIIPVFNTEKYLTKCLDSVCNQTLSDIEIICIDDCSTDNSLNILKDYALEDSRIKVIEFKENKGAAVARNIGIEEASGEYIGFVDSDDYIDLDFYENLYKKAQTSHSDVVKGSNYKIIWPDGKVVIDLQNDKIKKSKLNFWNQYTTAIYKRKFIINNKITFPLNMIVGEDPVFAIKTAILSNNIEVIDSAQYYYSRRENSLNTEYWDQEKIDDYCRYIKIVSDFASKQNLSKDDNMLLFKRLCDDVRGNIVCRAYNRKIEKQLEELLKLVRSKRTKYPIRILFDAGIFERSMLSEKDRRGIFWVSHNILKKFINDSRFEVTLWLESFCGDEIFNKIKNIYDTPIVFSRIMLGKAMGYKQIPNKNFDLGNYDVYFNPAINSLLVDKTHLTTFVMMYDAMPCLDSKWFSPNASAEFFRVYRCLDKNSYAFSDSQSCKNDFIRFFANIDPNKIIVNPISTAQTFIPCYDKQKLEQVLSRVGVPVDARSKYIFYLGSVDDKRKNTLLNIKCFIEFIKRNNITDLYFYLGGSGAKNLEDVLYNKLGSLYKKYSKYIIKLGYVEDSDVNILYSNSLFFSFISEYEGFGMPPLEAMQSGTPVICADNSSLPEVVGDAALMVNAYDEEGIIKAFEKYYFNEDLRKEYIKKGLERAKLFSWDKTYKIISDKIIDVLQGKGEV